MPLRPHGSVLLKSPANRRSRGLLGATLRVCYSVPQLQRNPLHRSSSGDSQSGYPWTDIQSRKTMFLWLSLTLDKAVMISYVLHITLDEMTNKRRKGMTVLLSSLHHH